MRARKIAALVAVLSLVLAACAGSTEETTTTAETSATTQGTEAPATTQGTEATTTTVGATEATEVTIGLQLEPPTLDLTSSPAAAIPQVLLYNVYETLVRLQPDGSITGLLASDWEVSDDGLTYTFQLHDGVTFHNGEPLTADDVVFSINRVLEKEDHPFRTTFAPITNVEATDESTVVITVSQVSANLLFFLTQGQGVILEESAIDTLENSPVGTGPFSFGSWTVGDSIVINRNDAYWGEAPPLETVTFRYINDPSALTNAMLAGDIDILAGVSAPETLSSFAEGEFRIEEGETYGEIVLSLNGRRAPFDDVLVRQAVSHAIDRQAIVDLAYAGYGTVIGSFASPLEPWYKDLSGVYEYDVQKAQDLMDQSGVGEVTVQMILPPISYAARSGEIIASQLAEIGITVEITNVEWGVWLEDVFTNYDFDMSIVSHVEPRDLAQYGNPDYYWGNDSPEVADLLAQADAEPDEAARNALYQQVLDGITEVAADNWLFVLPALAVTKTGVTGYKVDLPGSLDVTELALSE